MRWSFAAAFLVFATIAPSAQRSATYDSERQIRLEGAVTRIEWVNPRAFLFIDVRDPSGVVANWAVEIGNPIDLERGKWTGQSVRIGDVVTVDGVPARGPNRQALARSVVHKASSKRLFELPATRSAGAGRAAQRRDGPMVRPVLVRPLDRRATGWPAAQRPLSNRRQPPCA